FVSKLADADAEGAETQVWLAFARDCGYLTPEVAEALTQGYEEVGRMLGSMMAHPEKFAPQGKAACLLPSAFCLLPSSFRERFAMADRSRVRGRRCRPEEEGEPTFQEYEVPCRKDWVVLDGLNHVKDQLDGSLSFRWSCRMGICGSCGMTVNG